MVTAAVVVAAAGSKPKVFEGGDGGREERKIARDLSHWKAATIVIFARHLVSAILHRFTFPI